MYIIPYNNTRVDTPPLDISSVFEGGDIIPEGNWKYTFNKSPIEVLITDIISVDSMVLKIRGYIYDISRVVMNEVFVGSKRCPIIDSKRVGKIGNKIILDIRFMISKSDIKVIDEKTWSFHISTSNSFETMSLFCKESPIKYLCAITESPSAVATDVCPFSFTLLWPQGTRNASVLINSHEIESGESNMNELKVHTIPETEYICKIDNGLMIYEVIINTPCVTRDSFSTYYRSCKVGENTYDLTHTSVEVVKDLRFNNVIKSGDRIILNDKFRGLMAIESGGTINGSGSFYVIPTFEEGCDDQYLCMESEEGSHMITFDNSESYVDYGESRYFHGDKFSIGSRLVEVVKGSLILIIHDDMLLPLPGGTITATQVGTSGDIVLRDLIMRSSNQVTDKISGDYTYGISSYFVYDSIQNKTLETTRIAHGLDDAGTTGNISLNVLYTDNIGITSLHKALHVEPSYTSFSSVKNETDGTTSSLEATFDSSGLRFNSDLGDVYFGSSQEFRIHFEPASGNDPSMLQIQGLDSSTGNYITRQLITNEPVN